MSTELFREDDEIQYEVKAFKILYSLTGKRYEFTLNGSRDKLQALAELISAGGEGEAAGQLLREIPGIPESIKAYISTDVIAHTPPLDWKGDGLLGELMVYGEDGAKEGDDDIASEGSAEGDPGQRPRGATCSFIYEPNDVDLRYGLPFREFQKWDLIVKVSEAFSPVPDIFVEICGSGVNDFRLLDLINAYLNGAFKNAAQQNAFFAAMKEYTALDEFLLRWTRGQQQYRFWIPHLTITTRYRTMPNLTGDDSEFAGPNTFAEKGEDGGPPQWSPAPSTDANGFAYTYWYSGPQLNPGGDVWVVEEQWHGFLDMDKDLYDVQYEPEN